MLEVAPPEVEVASVRLEVAVDSGLLEVVHQEAAVGSVLQEAVLREEGPLALLVAEVAEAVVSEDEVERLWQRLRIDLRDHGIWKGVKGIPTRGIAQKQGLLC